MVLCTRQFGLRNVFVRLVRVNKAFPSTELTSCSLHWRGSAFVVQQELAFCILLR